MSKTILYIDGENLKHYVKEVLRKSKIPEKDATLLSVDLPKLLDKVLKGIKVTKKIYYSARLRQHKETLEKSKELIQKQRAHPPRRCLPRTERRLPRIMQGICAGLWFWGYFLPAP